MRHETAEVQHGDRLHDLESHVHVVLDEQDREPRVQAFDESGHLPALAGRETGGGLIKQQHARPPGQREEHLQLALLPIGEGVDFRLPFFP